MRSHFTIVRERDVCPNNIKGAISHDAGRNVSGGSGYYQKSRDTTIVCLYVEKCVFCPECLHSLDNMPNSTELV